MYNIQEHYNSVRLLNDFANDIPEEIPLSMIENAELAINSGQANDNNNMDSEPEEESLEVTFSEFSVKDISLQGSSSSTQEYILTDKQEVRPIPSDFAKCFCMKIKKKFKNCCLGKEFRGQYDKDNKIFYCDIEKFKEKYNLTEKKQNSEVKDLTKQMDKIFI